MGTGARQLWRVFRCAEHRGDVPLRQDHFIFDVSPQAPRGQVFDHRRRHRQLYGRGGHLHRAHQGPGDVRGRHQGCCLRLNYDFQAVWKENGIQIWCRRAGPNYLEGLKKLKIASNKLGLGVKVGFPSDVEMFTGLWPRDPHHGGLKVRLRSEW